MTKSIRQTGVRVFGLAVSMLLLGMVNAKSAPDKMVPFEAHVIGHISVDSDGVMWSHEVGIGTHLGKYTELVNITTGEVTITAANGDHIFGWLTFISATEGEVEILGGTGRFDGATGYYSVTVSPINSDTIAAELSGWISNVGSAKH